MVRTPSPDLFLDFIYSLTIILSFCMLFIINSKSFWLPKIAFVKASNQDPSEIIYSLTILSSCLPLSLV